MHESGKFQLLAHDTAMDKYKIRITTVDQHVELVEIERDKTVLDLKTQIVDSFAAPVDSQKLIFCGRVLSDTTCLRDLLHDQNDLVTFHLAFTVAPDARRSSTNAAASSLRLRGHEGLGRESESSNIDASSSSSTAFTSGHALFPPVSENGDHGTFESVVLSSRTMSETNILGMGSPTQSVNVVPSGMNTADNNENHANEASPMPLPEDNSNVETEHTHDNSSNTNSSNTASATATATATATAAGVANATTNASSPASIPLPIYYQVVLLNNVPYLQRLTSPPTNVVDGRVASEPSNETTETVHFPMSQVRSMVNADTGERVLLVSPQASAMLSSRGYVLPPVPERRLLSQVVLRFLRRHVAQVRLFYRIFFFWCFLSFNRSITQKVILAVVGMAIFIVQSGIFTYLTWHRRPVQTFMRRIRQVQEEYRRQPQRRPPQTVGEVVPATALAAQPNNDEQQHPRTPSTAADSASSATEAAVPAADASPALGNGSDAPHAATNDGQPGHPIPAAANTSPVQRLGQRIWRTMIAFASSFVPRG